LHKNYLGTASKTLKRGPSAPSLPLFLSLGSPAEKNESTGRSLESTGPEVDAGGLCFLVVLPSRSLPSSPRLSPLKLQTTGLPVVAGGRLVVGKSADLGFSCVGIVGLVVGGLVGAAVVLLVVVLLLKVGAGLRVTTTCVGAALGLRVVVACLGVGLAGLLGAAGACGRLESTFGKAVNGVTATVGRAPGRAVGAAKLPPSKPPPDGRLGKEFCPSPNWASNWRTLFSNWVA